MSGLGVDDMNVTGSSLFMLMLFEFVFRDLFAVAVEV